MQLDPIAAEAGVRLLALGTVGSTNKEARARARIAARRGPLWITAQTQTEGRGRMDRSWISPAGQSLCEPPSSPSRRRPSARRNSPSSRRLAVRDAIVAAAPALAPQLAFKWPNDLLLAGGKCAGILIEGEAGPGRKRERRHRHWRELHEPSGGRDRSSGDRSCAPTAPISPPQQLFRRLSATMCRRLAQWDRGPRLFRHSRRLACRRARHRRGDYRAQWRRRKARPFCRARSIRPAPAGTCAAAASKRSRRATCFRSSVRVPARALAGQPA